VALAVARVSPLGAQVSLGTWVRQSQSGGAAGGMTMTVEACCGASGRRYVYRLAGRTDVLMTIESPMDGTEVPVMVGGKPSGETMAIKRLDDHHTSTILKMNGKQIGTSKATLSADGKTLTVENDMTETTAGTPGGKGTDTWVRK
jgi:hypothetical protein